MRIARAAASAWIALALVSGCAGMRRLSFPPGPLRLSELVTRGDPVRRASLRLVIQGLASDGRAEERLAMSQYERAIQIDPTNPFAYLAIARHFADGDDSPRALEYLDQAEILLDAQSARSPRVEPHLLGIRGVALESAGRGAEAVALLTHARRLAPIVWGDGRLTADELR